MSLSPPPNQIALQNENNKVNDQWQEFFTFVFKAIQSVQASGTTLQRPVKGLYIGRVYFDTTLGFPIWYNGTNWVNSAGVSV